MKNKHLNIDDRTEIQQCLYHNCSFKHIAKKIGKDQTTISKEIKRNITIKEAPINANKGVCPKLLKPPFVCNSCKQSRYACGYQKQYYYAKMAQQKYEFTLKDCRSGIALNSNEFYETDKILTECLRKGQRLYHIMQTENIKQSSATIYRYLKKGYLSATYFDFPRILNFKPRKGPRIEYIPPKLKIGRTYADFQAYCEANDVKNWVEMDTVIGKIGGYAILTMIFTDCNFMFGLLLNKKTSAEITDKFLSLRLKLKNNGFMFEEIFPVILTDNGGEFSNIYAIENSNCEDFTSKLFFCEPYKSSQKPKVEKNHVEFRNIVPKGMTFNKFTQEDINIIFSHINNTKRKILHGKTPYELFTFLYSEKLANTLGIFKILANEVIQSPKLLEKIK